MKIPALPDDQVDISSDDSPSSSSSDGENDSIQAISIGESISEFTPAEWLLRSAKSYQQYMKLIPIPTQHDNIIPFTSWFGLGNSIKMIYGQPLHYLTNIHLKELDRTFGNEDENNPMEMIIHPCKAEASIWIIEQVHRCSSSPYHLAKLWEADPRYHVLIDAIFPKLGS